MDKDKIDKLLSAGRRWREARTAYMTDNAVTCREYGLAGDALALAISEFDSRASVAAPPPDTDDGWVTFGRVKSDIQNETETFERIYPPVPSPVAAPVDVETPRRIVGSSRHPHFTAADHQRMKETLDALSEYPTEEEAEAVLQACGTSGKEVVNEFIERLLRENLELKQKLARAGDGLVDEVQHRMDEVVEAAVEWHHAGRIGGEWMDAAERLTNAIDSLLELRGDPLNQMPRRHCSVHNREEFKYESLEHELRAASPATDAAPAINPHAPLRCPYCDHYGLVRDGRCRAVGTIAVQGGEAATTCDCECPTLTPAKPSAPAIEGVGRLPFICNQCKTQQHADGICANCGSSYITTQPLDD